MEVVDEKIDRREKIEEINWNSKIQIILSLTI